MSYILDALRKADAQRERDPARGIHAQAHRPIGTLGERRGARSPVLWGVAAAALAVLAAAGWYLYAGRNAPAQDRASRVATAAGPAAGTGAAVAVPAAAAPAPVVGVTPVPAPVAVPAAPAVATRIEPPAPAIRQVQMPERDPRATSQPPMRGNLQTPPGAPPQPGVNPAPAPAAAGAPAAPAAPTQGSVPGPAAAPANGASVAAPSVTPGTPPQPVSPVPPPAAPPVVAAPAPQPVAGLPPDAPRLSISGGVYSNNRAQRMLIVNGQVFNEGSEIGPGVVLEEIKAKTALLRFRGSRYTVPY